MIKKIGTILFVIGIAMMLIGMPYLLGYSTNECLKYPLYLGLLVTVILTPTPTKRR
ncbi:hypothetical protein LAV72_14360 [Lysinibacillus xylanilyticus]|uniref:hypothetical protein n=1 Tax=Lysinibacillus xylanilyticus TaxID=582475 RepID=UPI002B248FBC|nr:hypothetical protein [Lysinibacillus xylanilyticus]MEB2300801.1 hypothetical protein [Lysinibacillus xylanilyticus]